MSYIGNHKSHLQYYLCFMVHFIWYLIASEDRNYHMIFCCMILSLYGFVCYWITWNRSVLSSGSTCCSMAWMAWHWSANFWQSWSFLLESQWRAIELTQNMGVPTMGVPNSWMVFVRKNPIKMDDDWGYPHWWKHPHSQCTINFDVALHQGHAWCESLSLEGVYRQEDGGHVPPPFLLTGLCKISAHQIRSLRETPQPSQA